NQAYGDIAKFFWSNGHFGRPSGVNQMNVGCAKTGRNGCILEPLKQAVIELLIRIKLTLQEVVLDQELAQCSDADLFFGYCRSQELFPAARCYVIIPQPLDHSLPFCVDER